MAGIAGGREGSGNVVGIGGPVKVFLVAAVTGGRHGFVVVVDMAQGAGHGGVRANQREYRGVIEGRGGPDRGVMAESAIGRESRCNVVGIGGPGEVFVVASVAGGRQRSVVVIDMALRAGDLDVRAGEGKRCLVVVETRPGPVGGAVASGAGSRKASRRVGWSVCLGVIRLVAAVAVLGERGEVVVGVAGRAGDGGMRAGQGEYGSVIEVRSSPGNRGMAERAVIRESRCYVVGIGGFVEVGHVAAVAG